MAMMMILQLKLSMKNKRKTSTTMDQLIMIQWEKPTTMTMMMTTTRGKMQKLVAIQLPVVPGIIEWQWWQCWSCQRRRRERHQQRWINYWSWYSERNQQPCEGKWYEKERFMHEWVNHENTVNIKGFLSISIDERWNFSKGDPAWHKKWKTNPQKKDSSIMPCAVQQVAGVISIFRMVYMATTHGKITRKA